MYVSKSPLLTGVAGLQYTISIFSKRFLKKFVKGPLKITENSQEKISNGVPCLEFTDVQVLALGLGCM